MLSHGEYKIFLPGTTPTVLSAIPCSCSRASASSRAIIQQASLNRLAAHDGSSSRSTTGSRRNTGMSFCSSVGGLLVQRDYLAPRQPIGEPSTHQSQYL